MSACQIPEMSGGLFLKKQRWFSILLVLALLVTAVPAVSASADSQIDVTMEMEYGQSEARKMMDAINEDLYKYIGDWKDIKYFNYIKFLPRRFLSDTKEHARAYIESIKTYQK